MSGVAIEARGLGRTVKGGMRILDGVSFSVAPGELVGIVGGSGAGKTTLLEALAGVRPAKEGSVLSTASRSTTISTTFARSSGTCPKTTSSTSSCRSNGR